MGGATVQPCNPETGLFQLDVDEPDPFQSAFSGFSRSPEKGKLWWLFSEYPARAAVPETCELQPRPIPE